MVDEKPPSQKSFARLVAEAALNIPNVTVVGVAAVGAAALHSLPVAALGGATYLAMVAWDMVSPDFWRKRMAGRGGGSKGPSPLPERGALASKALVEARDAFVASRDTLQRAFDEAPDNIKLQLTSAMVLAGELEGRAAALLKRGDEVERYLRTVDTQRVRYDLAKLQEQEREATDPGAREQYQQAGNAKLEQSRALADLNAAAERARANLARMVAVLDALAVKVARMRAMDAAAMDSVTGDLGKELEDVNAEMRLFEESLAGLNVKAGGSP